MDEPTRVLRIVDGNRYEVNDKGGIWRPGDGRRAGPIPYLRMKVHGHAWGAGWRQLLAIAGDDAPSVFGVFIKLLELAADQPKELRWDIRDHRGIAESRKIPEITGFPTAAVEKAIQVLTDKRLRWLEWAEAPGIPGPCSEQEQEQNKKNISIDRSIDRSIANVDVWERAFDTAVRVIKPVMGSPANKTDRILALKVAFLSESGVMPQSALAEALAAVREAKTPLRNRWAYLCAVLADRLGGKRELATALNRLKLPDEYLDPARRQQRKD